MIGTMGTHETDRVYSMDERSRTLKATDYKKPVRLAEVKKIGNWLGHNGGNFAGAVFDKTESAPTLRTPTGGNTQVSVITEAGGAIPGAKINTKGILAAHGYPRQRF